MDNFHMSGKKMIEMGREAFLSRSPPFMGDILWEHLDVLQRGSFKFSIFQNTRSPPPPHFVSGLCRYSSHVTKL